MPRDPSPSRLRRGSGWARRGSSEGGKRGIQYAARRPLFGPALEGYNELNEIISSYLRWWESAANLQIAPTQRTFCTMEVENDSRFRSLDPDLHETLKERGTVEVEEPGQSLDTDRPSLEPLDPLPERLLPKRRFSIQLGLESIGSRIKRPIGNGWPIREIECGADAEVSPATSIHEMMHHAAGVVADPLSVVLEIVRIAGHGYSYLVLGQEMIKRSESLC